jgi:hypothetical protein
MNLLLGIILGVMLTIGTAFRPMRSPLQMPRRKRALTRS